MIMKSGEQWHCTNPACHCEVLVRVSGDAEGANPRCACGAMLKKNYVSPHITYLEFLRIEEPIPASAASHKG